MITPADYVKQVYRDAACWTDAQEVQKRHELCVTLSTRFGLNSRRIAARLNMHESTVRYVLKKSGMKPKQINPVPPETIERIIRLADRGVKLVHVAEICNVSIATVRRHLTVA